MLINQIIPDVNKNRSDPQINDVKLISGVVVLLP